MGSTPKYVLACCVDHARAVASGQWLVAGRIVRSPEPEVRGPGRACTVMTADNQVSSRSAAGPSPNVPTAGPTRLVIVGATGMVGGYALRYALQNPAAGTVTVIGRKKFGIYPAFRVLFPNQVIRADDLARTMVDVVVLRTGERRGLILENRDIRAMLERD